MIDFEFALQAWPGISECLDAAGVDSSLRTPGGFDAGQEDVDRGDPPSRALDG